MTTTTLDPAAPAAALRLKIAGMDCGSCAQTIEKAVGTLPGVDSVRVDFTTELLNATGDVSREQVERKLKELGYSIAEERASAEAPRLKGQGFGGFMSYVLSERRTQIAFAATVAIALAAIAAAFGPAGGRALDVVLMATVVVVGLPIVIKGFRSLLVARQVTIDLLMGIAAIGAVLIGEAGEAAAVVLLFTLGEALEAYSAERSRDALRSLLSLQPDEATVLESHDDDHGHDHGHARARHDDHEHEHGGDDGHHDHGGSCSHDDHDHGHDHGHAVARVAHVHQVRRPTGSVPTGATVLVRPGERIPLDGRVLSGTSGVNQAAVTGESMPVDRTVGDEVLAGTVNGHGALTIEVTRPAGDSTVARIARMVEQALAERTPAERFIDRFARWYTPLVVGLAVLFVAIPVLLFGQPFLDTPDGSHGWLYRGLTLLIIACPCALIISIPVTVVSALTNLARQGVLVKGGAQLDRLASIGILAFDKTGTLTAGHPVVTTVWAPGCGHDEPADARCPSCDDVVSLAAAVETASEHPLARAVIAHATHRGIVGRSAASDVTAHAGRGVSGELGGRRISVGSHALLGHGPDCGDPVCLEAARAEASGKTVMVIGRDNKALGYIGVEDRPRPEAHGVLTSLHEVDAGLRTVMLTGDNTRVADAVATQIGGLDEVKAGLLPEDKLGAIVELRSRGVPVAMIGDGINDAPALARADIGIAMGDGGTAQAMETADIVLMKDDLAAVPMALRVSRLTRRVIKQNIGLSLGLKLAVLVLAVPGIATLWLAVLADVGATLIVTLNGMRLLRAR